MSNIVSNTDAKISVLAIDLLWKEEVAQNSLDIFSYKGEETPEMAQLVTNTRARFQEINGLIARIMAALPA